MNDTIRAAAEYLVEARRERRTIPRLPEECRPQDVDAAFAIQARVGQLLGESVGGWKCSAPSPGKVMAAPIYASNLYKGPRCPVVSTSGTASIEPEIAFVLARDLPAREAPYTAPEIDAAIGEARLVLELIGSRYTEPKDADFPEKLADALSNQGLYLGPVIKGGVTPEMGSFEISVEADGAPSRSFQGKHPDGHPLVPMHWLPNFLSAMKIGLSAGQVITTGSYAGVIDVPVGTPLRVQFGNIGTIKVELAG